eukprot:m.3861 g.3861  ORF g.3861 m.3861 type:complete len:546 (+) comp3754_c0_seq1:106-1743(+)
MLARVCRQTALVRGKVAFTTHSVYYNNNKHIFRQCHTSTIAFKGNSTNNYSAVHYNKKVYNRCGTLQTRRCSSSGADSANEGLGGRFVDMKDEKTPYKTGQYFIHDKLGYRGVITAAWKAKVYSYDTSGIASSLVLPDDSDNVICDSMEGNTIQDGMGTLFGVKKRKFQLTQVSMKLLHAGARDIIGFKVPIIEREEYWYQVMADRRDFASDIRTNIACRNLSVQPINVDYVDYVSHDNIIPIVPDNPSLFYDNNFFNMLFQPKISEDDEPRAIGFTIHDRWVASVTKLLAHQPVFETKSHGISIKIIPFYAFQSQYCHNWQYKVVIESDDDVNHCLVQRLWVTQDAHGQVDLTIGRGVVGYEPKLSPSTSFFSYSSKTFMETDKGVMGGFFTFVDDDADDGHILHIPTPTFMLSKPSVPEEVDAIFPKMPRLSFEAAPYSSTSTSSSTSPRSSSTTSSTASSTSSPLPSTCNSSTNRKKGGERTTSSQSQFPNTPTAAVPLDGDRPVPPHRDSKHSYTSTNLREECVEALLKEENETNNTNNNK